MAALTTAATSVRSLGQEVIFDDEIHRQSGSRVEAVSIFDELPGFGCAAIRVTITNRTDRDRTWQLRSTASFHQWIGSGYMQATQRETFSLGADRNSVAVHTVLVPIPSTLAYHGSRPDLQLSLSAPGMEEASGYKYSEGNSNWPTIAISKALASRSMTDLRDEVGKTSVSGSSRSNFFGAVYDPSMLPADWRASFGFDIILITDEEWLDLEPGARTAILEWIHLGGRLEVYTSRPDTRLGALGITGSEDADAMVKRGLGRVALVEWDGNQLDAPKTVSRYDRIVSSSDEKPRMERIGSGYSSHRWSLFQALGERSFGTWQVALLLIAFGILVGPVNLFVLARAGRRHRMFFTTPIISLGASVLLIALIFLQDGSGGKGQRFGFVSLDSDDRRAYLLQEQIARTGVLFGNGFDTGEPAFLTPVVSPPSRWGFLSGSAPGRPLDYTQSGTFHDGDWFQSRSEQAHFIATVRPTRARVERQGVENGRPLLVSALDVPVQNFIYLDADGSTWRADAVVAAGNEFPLVPCTIEEAKSILEASVEPGSDWLQADIKALLRPPPADSAGIFFAQAAAGERDAATATFVPTLPSIQWSDAALVLHGTVTKAGNTPNPNATEVESGS